MGAALGEIALTLRAKYHLHTLASGRSTRGRPPAQAGHTLGHFQQVIEPKWRASGCGLLPRVDVRKVGPSPWKWKPFSDGTDNPNTVSVPTGGHPDQFKRLTAQRVERVGDGHLWRRRPIWIERSLLGL